MITKTLKVVREANGTYHATASNIPIDLLYLSGGKEIKKPLVVNFITISGSTVTEHGTSYVTGAKAVTKITNPNDSSYVLVLNSIPDVSTMQNCCDVPTTGVTCGPAATNLTFGTTTQTTQVVNWTNASGTNTYDVTFTNGGTTLTFLNQVSGFTATGLTAGTTYVVHVITRCVNTANFVSGNVTTTAAPTLNFRVKTFVSDPYVNDTTQPDMTGATVISPLTHNADLIFNLASPDANKFIVVQVISTESTKTLWYHNTLNNGSIPDATWRSPFTISGQTNYVTRAAFVLDPSSTIQLKS